MDREQSISYAKKYVEDILSFFGLNTEVAVTSEDDVIEIDIPSTHLNGFLIGQRGDTLRSLQQLLVMSLTSKEADLNRVSIDVAGYKRQRAERLAEQVKDWADQVMQSGEPMHLKPMNAADRRVVHNVISDYDSLSTASEGENRDRHVVITKK